jgi:hypothetical protein
MYVVVLACIGNSGHWQFGILWSASMAFLFFFGLGKEKSLTKFEEFEFENLKHDKYGFLTQSDDHKSG